MTLAVQRVMAEQSLNFTLFTGKKDNSAVLYLRLPDAG